MFDEASSWLGKQSTGIVEYHLDDDTLEYWNSGESPRRHPGGKKTVVLQKCGQEGLTLTVYRVVVLDEQGMILHKMPCSRELGNKFSTTTNYEEAALSPDESLVAVQAYFNDGSYDNTYHSVVVFDLEGNQVWHWDNAMDPAWTPDGRLLMATLDKRFFLTDRSLKKGEHIAHGEFSAHVFSPAVHPDGDRFLFSYNGQIWSMKLDGTDLQMIEKSPKQLRHPAWSPDGNAFVFTAWEGGDYGSSGVRAMPALYIHDMRDHERYKVDLRGRLDAAKEPWPPLSWTP